MGRNNKYITHIKPYLNDIKKWYVEMTEAEIIKKLGIGATSWEKYKKDYPELKEVLTDGKQELVVELKQTLKRKALGFHYTETKTNTRIVDGSKIVTVEEVEKYSPPDVGAIHLLLKNYDKDWRNDDLTTIELKRQKLELEKEREWK